MIQICWVCEYYMIGLMVRATMGQKTTDGSASFYSWKGSIFLNSRTYGGFPKLGIPQNGWFIEKIPLKWMISGYLRRPPYYHFGW